ncbi:PepSY-associated TM helix domain-containing protein [Fictibacillus phosphorivorans]|uniref:PepSY-associated TM helix domain-containing protein n=1 Tax=Fictibacillus phosphorivorans TaxID=1221500 RepID=UPI00203E921C|nr:PepSY domain-containing protein [Fictibacillus phosphorivorans]MCM3719068.1 PepSY domain-containing protein [Fictibacillus phosphorivorans]MCM3776690.1 PepSY domain-containing protein [Fictibacillus phosphorivorans]
MMQSAAHEFIQKHDDQGKKANSLYQIFWRWHFYGGIIFAPFLILLAISGALYLYQSEIETMLYKDKLIVQQGEKTVPLSLQTEAVKKEFPNAEIGSVRLPKEGNRATLVKISENDVITQVYVDPYTAKVTGTILDDKHFKNVIAKLHSEWIVGGTFVNRLVELAACWTVIILVTGLYIWWPRNKLSLRGTLFPRLKKNGRIFWRDLHAVTAFWLSLMILILIITGLPWSDVMGEQVNKLATSAEAGYPTYAWTAPKAKNTTDEVAEDIPWATENNPVPVSERADSKLSLDQVMYLAHENKIQKPYTISNPVGEDGVYTVASSRDKPENEATVYFNQYNGEIVEEIRFSDYGWMAKAISIGIAIHEGHYFGLANQLLGTVAALGLIVIVIFSLIMWKKRKPRGKLGIPKKSDKKRKPWLLGLILITGVLMPLAGISFILVYLLDRFIIPKIKPLQVWLS